MIQITQAFGSTRCVGLWTFISTVFMLALVPVYGQDAPKPAETEKAAETSPAEEVKSDSVEKTAEPVSESANPRVLIKTNQGEIELEMFIKAAPETVANFIGLAEGTKEFTDPKTGEKVKRHYYDGLTFHRVIPDFMIQGGCPLGTGSGDPGYKFADEINADALGLNEMLAVPNGQPHPHLLIRSQSEFQSKILAPLFERLKIKDQNDLNARMDEVRGGMEQLTLKDAYTGIGYEFKDGHPSEKPLRGVIAMANSGPNTNGSQFFINVADTPHLTGKHTVFGKVVRGMEVVDAVSKAPTSAGSKPTEPIIIESIRVIRK